MFQPVGPHELESFFAYVVSVLERLSIPYMVVGGFAAITYGELRFTADVDIVSEKHLRDARGIVVTQWGRLNLDDVARWACAAGVEETWLALLEAAREKTSGE